MDHLCLGSELTCETFLRRMRGGSRSVLIEASDHSLYVIKSMDNSQGPNLPFNEALGSMLSNFLGLPTPSWFPVEVDGRFIRNNWHLWAEDTGCIPQPGLYFGSHFLASSGQRAVYEIIPKAWLAWVRNPTLFGRMLLLDIWADNRDRRQALFVRRNGERFLDVVFFDHGHMFGGPGNEHPNSCTGHESRYYDGTVYSRSADIPQLEVSLSRIEHLRRSDIEGMISGVPRCWREDGQARRAADLLMENQASLRDRLEAAIARLGGGGLQVLKDSSICRTKVAVNSSYWAT